ncbi:serine hydrolase [Emticicia sp. BO119]|uniref:serine hydrolase n=1 Tax=Emticicia sp. BO119 TaxID=2757768 RepID=UPI0015F05146|nr:serine hydrolase [Emticicia sp. BO119]MBA4851420.1 serine hydrolase [Emticicia sp. BO119]
MKDFTNLHKRILIKLSLIFLFFTPLISKSQENKLVYDAVKEVFIVKFNKGDYSGIYSLFDDAFRNKISEKVLVNFLKGNQNSGRILNSSLQSVEKDKFVYLLEFELREMLMDIQLNEKKQIRSFGLRNVSPLYLTDAPAVQTNNLKKTAIDQAVDSAAREYFKFANATSLSIGIIKNGKKYEYYYGETTKGNGKIPDAETLYEIGSITKTFTATLLAQAVLDKKLNLHDDIRKYLPSLFSNLSFKDTPITFQSLANHTSRLPALPADIGDKPNYNPVSPEAHYDSSMFYQALQKVVLDTIPGHTFLYSNWGIALLGHILENIYKQTQSDLIARYITTPLGMRNTFYLENIGSKKVALPHSENGKTLIITDQGYFDPAGGLCSTLPDMLRYLEAQLQEQNPAIRLTHTPTANNMGLGWGVRTIEGKRDFQHNGSEQGSTAHISGFPDNQGGCVILINNKINAGKLINSIQAIVRSKAYE